MWTLSRYFLVWFWKVTAETKAMSTSKVSSASWATLGVQKHCDPETRDVLAFAERLDRWYVPWLLVLSTIDKYDEAAILCWRNDTIADAQNQFGLTAPISAIETSAADHLKVLQEPGTPYQALREGIRFRDALSSIASRVATSDELWELLYSEFDAKSVSQIIDCALFDLISSDFGQAERAFWKASVEINQAGFGRHLSINFQDFLDHLPADKTKTVMSSGN
jgi:hypothetical protein